jgi:hypothetical protein
MKRASLHTPRKLATARPSHEIAAFLGHLNTTIDNYGILGPSRYSRNLGIQTRMERVGYKDRRGEAGYL